MSFEWIIANTVFGVSSDHEYRNSLRSSQLSGVSQKELSHKNYDGADGYADCCIVHYWQESANTEQKLSW